MDKSAATNPEEWKVDATQLTRPCWQSEGSWRGGPAAPTMSGDRFRERAARFRQP